MNFLWEYAKVVELKDIDLAKRLSVSRAHISALRLDKSTPSPRFMVNVAKVFPDLRPKVLVWFEEQTRKEA